ncbi:hypothetical protein C7444_107165 [Sphaerotilus hippei]|uniref:Tfp pilus assembly protein PilX n=1 Tax=Sphaerotilus hippei TaxID=744406 RepID=A0A318H0D2_9BURK|nr:hypothetical protein [Sphaerotilus hippei]PXW96259.1 hypothetical protein C7444_107165 [Sphaerotilus hippei]
MTPRHRLQHQRGSALILTLIALAAMLLAGAALIRAMDNSLLQVGNIAYRRDLVHQAQRAVGVVSTAMTSGALATEAAREADLASANYYASLQASNAQGIPTVLTSDAAFTAAGLTGADLTDSDTGVTLRYVVDRQCASAGDYSTRSCVLAYSTTDNSADAIYRKVNAEGRAVYRITVRATGPRNTQAFFQATIAR